MGSQPVYRYPPRSHAADCPCNRCVQCRTRKSPGGDLIGMDMGCLVVVLVFAAIAGISGLVARHPHAALAAVAGAGVLAVVIWGVVYANRRALRPPKGRLRVEATRPASVPPMSSMPPTAAESRVMAARACYHLDAVPVDLSTGERVAWWCEACQTQLEAEFGRLMRPCCGSAPGTKHLYNCPHRR